MPALNRPIIRGTTVAAIALLLVSITACQHPKPVVQEPPKVVYHETYDDEIKQIMELARKNRWEEARTNAMVLAQKDPKNPILNRVRTWVEQQAQLRRAQALEDTIRSVDAKNSVFNPTLRDVLTEQKDRGLPPRKDVRDAVDRIENTPYIPDTYGKLIREKGPLFDFESAKGPMAKVLEKEIPHLHLDNVPLETILVNLSQSAGVNFVADKSIPALKQVIGVNLDKVKLGEFLRYVGRNYDLQFQVGPELVWVVDAKDPKKLMEETRFYRLRKGFVLPAAFGAPDAVKTTTTAGPVTTVNEVQKFNKFVNDEAPVMPSIERAITNLFTGSKYFLDYEHNLIVARGTPEQLDVMERIIQEFDQPIQQVLIEARFVTVSKPAFMQLGVLWEADRQSQSVQVQGTSVPQDFTGVVNGQTFPSVVSGAAVNPAVGIGIQHAFTKVFGVNELTATISAMEQTGESQTLSAPRLTVLNNRPATISDGNVQYYYEEYEVATTVQQYYTAASWVPKGKPTKITGGAVLHVLASISGDGKSIVLALNPVVNTDVQLVKYATLTQFGGGTNVVNAFDIKLPQYRTEEISTRVAVKSGETVVMGGVLERSKSTYVEAVPVLGNLPLIGPLFRRRTETDIPRYLLVFVTATIVTDSGEFLVYEEPTTNSVARPK